MGREGAHKCPFYVTLASVLPEVPQKLVAGDSSVVLCVCRRASPQLTALLAHLQEEEEDMRTATLGLL